MTGFRPLVWGLLLNWTRKGASTFSRRSSFRPLVWGLLLNKDTHQQEITDEVALGFRPLVWGLLLNRPLPRRRIRSR